MMCAWTEKFINVNGYARSGKKLTGVKKLVVHYTANPGASAENHYRYFNTLNDRYASAHIFVDKTEAINIIPLTEVAYHAGDIQKRNADGSAWRGVKELLPSANNLSIGVEICIEKDGSFHPDTIARTEDVFVDLCKKYNLDPLCDIVRHRDVTWKNCPAPWVDNEQLFHDFKAAVNAKLNPPKPVVPSQPVELKEVIPPYVPTNNGVIAKVKVLVDGLNIRVAPDVNADVTRKAKKDEVFNVFANVNDWHNVGQANWIFGNNGKYLSLVKEDPKPEYPGHPIKNGSTNTLAIKEIQKEIGVISDGVWGPKTDVAVKAWQKNMVLAADGIIGPVTWGKLF
jgi:N-acetylmuramoyl-L-alanine amidase